MLNGYLTEGEYDANGGVLVHALLPNLPLGLAAVTLSWNGVPLDSIDFDHGKVTIYKFFPARCRDMILRRQVREDHRCDCTGEDVFRCFLSAVVCLRNSA